MMRITSLFSRGFEIWAFMPAFFVATRSSPSTFFRYLEGLRRSLFPDCRLQHRTLSSPFFTSSEYSVSPIFAFGLLLISRESPAFFRPTAYTLSLSGYGSFLFPVFLSASIFSFVFRIFLILTQNPHLLLFEDITLYERESV